MTGDQTSGPSKPPGPAPEPGPETTKFADLKTRIISAAALGALAVIALFAGPIPFGIFVAAVAMIMSWEWSGIVRSKEIDVAMIVHIAVAGIACALAIFHAAALGLAAIIAGTILVFALTFGGRSIISAAGVLYTGMPAVAMIWIRQDQPMGLNAILYLIIVVIATDTFAFFAGRALGGPKLMPSLSPKKTWSGLVGGITGAALVAAGFGSIVDLPLLPLAIGAIILGVISQAGDLAESALKRYYGVKDASNLIPGHGGFMDRMDGIVAAAAAAGLMAAFLSPSAPAQFLRLWH